MLPFVHRQCVFGEAEVWQGAVTARHSLPIREPLSRVASDNVCRRPGRRSVLGVSVSMSPMLEILRDLVAGHRARQRHRHARRWHDRAQPWRLRTGANPVGVDNIAVTATEP